MRWSTTPWAVVLLPVGRSPTPRGPDMTSTLQGNFRHQHFGITARIINDYPAPTKLKLINDKRQTSPEVGTVGRLQPI
ncbi:hypothetical protein PGT21_015461 [Puccinia graminis f. sp. tritici]|uniref:Uncharacterized protein n=1 Tax=Puccinia graminis f. sp. tritici TaxID=56615 RepID=A0A5B0LW84_PUCGR|nr:hypothetical protein PGTUg99_036317 [Puccinia graminis f. sp. tritici]KAA1104226.1 hypothetical protein PGT21_015461 [Puccinia graminis f. sp. tritici]